MDDDSKQLNLPIEFSHSTGLASFHPAILFRSLRGQSVPPPFAPAKPPPSGKDLERLADQFAQQMVRALREAKHPLATP